MDRLHFAGRLWGTRAKQNIIAQSPSMRILSVTPLGNPHAQGWEGAFLDTQSESLTADEIEIGAYGVVRIESGS